MNQESKPDVIVEIPSPLPQLTTQRPWRGREESKIKLLDWLSFKGKDWEDIAFSAVIYVSAPMFAASLLLSGNPLLFCIFIVLVIVISASAKYLLDICPEASALVWGRLLLISLGLLLGGLL